MRGFNWFSCLFVTCISVQIFGQSLDNGESSDAPTPRFLSHGENFRAVIGNTLNLPCEIENIGNYILLWRRGSSVLTAGKLMVTRDKRFRLVNGFNLEIRDLKPQDAGDYICQLSDGEYSNQVHTVEILVPPNMRIHPGKGPLKLSKGTNYSLECKATGNPVPKIVWSRKNNSLPSGQLSVEGSTLVLENLDRHHTGVYLCTASNGVGEPLVNELQLDVLYPPDIEVERSWVHCGEGNEAQLVCIVHGIPTPEISWYQDNVLLDPSDRRTMETRDGRHTLILNDLQGSDFGNYSCEAKNSLGRLQKYMELSGRPSPADFKSPPFSRSWDSYNLTWVVESFPPLEEVRLLFRKLMVSSDETPPSAVRNRNVTYFQHQMNETYQYPGKWHEVILSPTHPGMFSQRMMSYNIRGLDQGSVFEAIVQAKNRYGWNEVSDLYQFYTRGAVAEPELENIEGLTSNSEDTSAGTFKKPIALITLILIEIMATMFL